jgi:hypothetical protein
VLASPPESRPGGPTRWLLLFVSSLFLFYSFD